MWGLDTTALPAHVLVNKSVTRRDGFDVGAEPIEADTNWRLFCTSFVFGYGPYGVGPARFRCIIGYTPQSRLDTVITEARRLLRECGPLSAYDYLRGSGRRAKVPWWGPVFFTKLLYFADTSGTAKCALILDNQMAWMIAKLCPMKHLVKRGCSQRWTAYRYGYTSRGCTQ
jgi:8-oxoguanine DNA glycosylase-like protein